VITGDRTLDRKLKHLAERSGRRAMARGVSAGMTVLGKACRAAINATPGATPGMKREARRAIGKRFQRGGTNRMGRTTAQVAKVGFAVGKRAAAAARARALGHEGRAKRIEAGETAGRGVGISIANIHWFVLGTKERQHKSGHPTGSMEGVFGDVTERAFAAGHGAALQAARDKIAAEIEKEARARA
jgi:hypothetical protein